MAEQTRNSDRFAPYPARRARQACENCRRKKSRCPGEQPTCSLCARLRQRCVYIDKRQQVRQQGQSASNPPARDIEEHARQLDTVNAKLDQLMAKLEDQNASSSQEQPARGNMVADSDNSPSKAKIPDSIEVYVSGNDSGDILLSSEIFYTPCDQLIIVPGHAIPAFLISEGVSLYIRNFHNQPYPLMSGQAIQDTTGVLNIDRIVLYPMLALSLRASNNPIFRDKKTMADVLDLLSEASWEQLSRAYSNFNIDLNYFKGLCLLAQVDLASGNPTRARAQIALGLSLAQDWGMLKAKAKPTALEKTSTESNAVMSTLIMLNRVLCGLGSASLLFPPSACPLLSFKTYPITSGELDGFKRETLQNLWDGGPLDRHLGIIPTNVELTRLWQMAMADINEIMTGQSTPFWKDGATWNQMQAALSDIEISKKIPADDLTISD